MQINEIVFDIETVPQSPLSETQQAKVDQNIERSEYWKNDTRKEMALNPWFGRVVCIGLYYPELNHKVGISSKDEKEILLRFWDEISPHTNCRFISFNGLLFDVPFIKIRTMVHSITPTNSNFLNSKRYQSFPHFDVAQHASDWEPRLRASLDLTCDCLGIPSPKHGEVVASNVAEYYEKDRLDLIEEYCLKDLEATHEVYKKVWRVRV
jgi:predicted PolB exonuclease-like 3'-5' exonuclease